MAQYSNADLVTDVTEQATAALMDFAPLIIASADGIGDQPLDRDGRLLRFMDIAQSGALDFLPVIKRQDLHDQLVKQYHEDLAAAMGKAS